MIRMIFFMSVLVAAQSESDGSNLDGGNNKLVHLGTVDGKSYFRDETARNWTTSKAYCESVGLQIASIRTENEALFLASKYDHENFINYYWIGARDSLKLREMVWDKTNTEPANFTSLPWHYMGTSDYQTCGAYSSWPSPYLEMIPCLINFRVLCQSMPSY